MNQSTEGEPIDPNPLIRVGDFAATPGMTVRALDDATLVDWVSVGNTETMDEADCRTLVASTPVGRLATARADGRVDLVPVVFASVGDDFVFAVDHKPKRTRQLQRLANIEVNPEVTVLFDRYDEDWDSLWWVRMRGRAILVPGGAAVARALDALQARHHQYAGLRPDGPVVSITPTEWTGWAASGDPTSG